jgi:hypothetical protein
VSQWPEPTPDESEPPRWRGIAGLVAAVSVIVALAVGRNDWFGTFEFPEVRMPAVELPELDLRGRTESEPASAPPTPTNATAPIVDASLGQVSQGVQFETCVEMISESANGLGLQPIIVEDTSDRRVAVFKFVQGDLTMICSRSDSTMTIQRREP